MTVSEHMVVRYDNQRPPHIMPHVDAYTTRNDRTTKQINTYVDSLLHSSSDAGGGALAVAVRRALLAGKPHAVRARRTVGARVVARSGRFAVAVAAAAGAASPALPHHVGPALVAARSVAGLATFQGDGNSARRDAVRATVVAPHRLRWSRRRCWSRHRRFWAERRTPSQRRQDEHGEEGGDGDRSDSEGG